ncbi:glucoside xylosyltransferase 1 isoform X2 [Pantherophis guttatus]|uniref:Glucoside xylosyltransferase 1 n=1 Tax=Pantherophis guttatus TaxID=94885 RepID=A0A6P9ANL0_PANGU|nr:glucoside xylosyltransferase 1 isoform X2 [Pantherophis guttatus]
MRGFLAYYQILPARVFSSGEVIPLIQRAPRESVAVHGTAVWESGLNRESRLAEVGRRFSVTEEMSVRVLDPAEVKLPSIGLVQDETFDSACLETFSSLSQMEQQEVLKKLKETRKLLKQTISSAAPLASIALPSSRHDAAPESQQPINPGSLMPTSIQHKVPETVDLITQSVVGQTSEMEGTQEGIPQSPLVAKMIPRNDTNAVPHAKSFTVEAEINRAHGPASPKVTGSAMTPKQTSIELRYDFPRPQLSERMHLAVVACGERLEETVTMLKSAIIFSIKNLQCHIFAEESLHSDFREILILSNVDSLLYVDTDILFLRPVDDIWSFLKKFNSTQIAAMAPEHEEPRIGWYNRFARHPYYGKTGINSGVMLMNMTRIRRKYFKNDMTSVRLRWEEILMPLLKKYKLNITWGDQDLLNIMFFHNPESLFVFPCQWNYRPDHCIYGSNCQEAEKEGIFILHGNRGVYHDDKQPTFRAVYYAIKNYSFEDDLPHALLLPLEHELQKTQHTYCGRIYEVFIKQLKESIRDLSNRRTKER